MEDIFKILGNFFFPMSLSIYLIFRIDQIMTKIVENQKDFQKVVLEEIRDIKKDIYEIRIDMAKSG